MHTGIANLPLRFGTYPPWLFAKMIESSRQILLVITSEFRVGNLNVIQKLSALV